MRFIVGDTQWFNAKSSDPAEEGGGNLYIEEVIIRDRRDNASHGDVVGKATKYGLQLAHHLPREFLPLAGCRINLPP